MNAAETGGGTQDLAEAIQGYVANVATGHLDKKCKNWSDLKTYINRTNCCKESNIQMK